MPLIARGAGSGDMVTCVAHGAPLPPPVFGCGMQLVSPLTLECSPDVIVGGFGAVRVGDKMEAHMRHLPPIETLCAPHSPPCITGSPNIFVNGKPVAREYDHYFEGNDHWISAVVGGSVMANGSGGSFTPIDPEPIAPEPPPPPPFIPFVLPF